MDKYSGQAQMVYKEDGQEFLYWAHLNDENEIAPFMTKAAEKLGSPQENELKRYILSSPKYIYNNPSCICDVFFRCYI